MKTQVYLAWIEYRTGNSHLIGVFSTPELAQDACLDHYRHSNFTTGSLDWARARNIEYHSTVNVGSYNYDVRQQTVDALVKV